MPDKINGLSIEDNSVTTSQMESNTWAQVYAALATANAAYNKANTVVTPGTNVASDLTFSTGKLGLGISPNTTLHVEGTTTLSDVIEKINVSATPMSANLNFDVLSQPILYLTSAATANCTVNFRANSTLGLDAYMRTGQAVTVSLLTTFDAIGYRVGTVLIDGVLQIPKWAGAASPVVGAGSSIDLYTFTIVKTGTAAWTVFGSQQRYG